VALVTPEIAWLILAFLESVRQAQQPHVLHPLILVKRFLVSEEHVLPPTTMEPYAVTLPTLVLGVSAPLVLAVMSTLLPVLLVVLPPIAVPLSAMEMVLVFNKIKPTIKRAISE
jgi:hypothetical protein